MVSAWVGKPGFYPTMTGNLSSEDLRTKGGVDREDPLVVVLTRVEKPVPMFVRQVEFRLSREAGRVGLDLETGDTERISPGDVSITFDMDNSTSAGSRIRKALLTPASQLSSICGSIWCAICFW